MSDYLTHLTNRITQGGDVQPRPTSRFESFQPADNAQDEQVEQGTVLLPNPLISPVQPQLKDKGAPNTAVSSQPSQDEQSVSPTIHQIVNQYHNSPPSVLNESSIIEQTYIVSPSTTPSATIEQPVVPQMQTEKETVVEKTIPLQTIMAHNHYPTERIVERPFAPTNQHADEAIVGTETRPSVMEKETRLEKQTIVEKHVVNTIRPNRPIQQIVLPPMSNVPSRRNGETAVSQPEPVINVTIGRIEVKANTPPAPTPTSKPGKKAPIMTLDEYLKRGRGGGS